VAKRVYFAFHYQDVIDFRANVVRKHNALQGVEQAGYYDHSIWEEAKKKGDIALKRMINSELEGTSVTCALIGSLTYERPWVRYEILKSIERGNALLGVHINSIKDRTEKTKAAGPNPFDYLAVSISQDGTQATPMVWSGSQWVTYSHVGAYSIAAQPPENRGRGLKLSHWYHTYDWIADRGYDNFSSWIGS